MGDATSINLQLGQQHSTSLAFVVKHKLLMQARKQNKVRLELIAAQGSNKASASTDFNTDERLAPIVTSTTSDSKNNTEQETIERSSSMIKDAKMTNVWVTFV